MNASYAIFAAAVVVLMLGMMTTAQCATHVEVKSEPKAQPYIAFDDAGTDECSLGILVSSKFSSICFTTAANEPGSHALRRDDGTYRLFFRRQCAQPWKVTIDDAGALHAETHCPDGGEWR